jgi:hypothetical protein
LILSLLYFVTGSNLHSVTAVSFCSCFCCSSAAVIDTVNVVVASTLRSVAALAAVVDAVIDVVASTLSSVAVVTVTVLAAGMRVVDETIALTEAIVDAHMFCEIRPFYF